MAPPVRDVDGEAVGTAEAAPRSAPGAATRDAVFALLVVVCGGAVFLSLDAVELVSGTVARFEAVELDDLLLTLVLAVAAASWLALRRFRESQTRLEALRRVQRERGRYMARLEELSARLVSVEAEERDRIAVILHDGVSQSLYAAQLRLDLLGARELDRASRRLLDDAAELVADAMRRTRDLTGELSPPGLHDLGLTDALRWMLSRIGDHHGLQVVLESSPAWRAVCRDHSALVHQAVQELVVNAAKHARATRVIVSAEVAADGAVVVRVEDDGCGFELADARGAGFGLLSIERRLSRLQARLRIDSAPSRGTIAIIMLPGGDISAVGAEWAAGVHMTRFDIS